MQTAVSQRRTFHFCLYLCRERFAEDALWRCILQKSVCSCCDPTNARPKTYEEDLVLIATDRQVDTQIGTLLIAELSCVI